jgi:ketosteroid isomerase-like protein
MTTRETIERYYAALRQNGAWQDLLSDEIHFTSFTSPVRELHGREAFLPGTKRFYGSIESFEVRDIITEGDRAIARTRYMIGAPGDRPGFSSDVAEVFTVRDAKIASFGIYFDTAPYPK